jgi:hypothetical protein
VALGAGRGHGAVKLCTAHRGTRSEVSRLIDRLKRRAARPTADHRREIRAVHDDLATNRGDAAEVREDLEVTGLRLDRHLQAGALVTTTIAQPPGARGATNERVELGRYTISAGERIRCSTA